MIAFTLQSIGVAMLLGFSTIGIATVLKYSSNKEIHEIFDYRLILRFIANISSHSSQDHHDVVNTCISDSIELNELLNQALIVSTSSHGVSHLYKSFQSCFIIIRVYLNLFLTPEQQKHSTVIEFLDYIVEIERNGLIISKYQDKLRVIVIEGLSKSGKSLLIQKLIKKSSKYRTVSLPDEYLNMIVFLNDIFSSRGNSNARTVQGVISSLEPVQYAFQCLQNYILTDQIVQDYSVHMKENIHYFLDTFYHSTCVTTIMSQVSEDSR